jgi:hypothetical protein
MSKIVLLASNALLQLLDHAHYIRRLRFQYIEMMLKPSCVISEVLNHLNAQFLIWLDFPFQSI